MRRFWDVWLEASSDEVKASSDNLIDSPGDFSAKGELYYIKLFHFSLHHAEKRAVLVLNDFISEGWEKNWKFSLENKPDIGRN